MIVSDDFFEPSGQEVKQLLAEEAKRREENSVLKTREMREREKQAKAITYESVVYHLYNFNSIKTDIRIRFPNSVIVQTTLQPNDTTESIANFVKQQLKVDLPFYLCKLPLQYTL